MAPLKGQMSCLLNKIDDIQGSNSETGSCLDLSQTYTNDYMDMKPFTQPSRKNSGSEIEFHQSNQS